MGDFRILPHVTVVHVPFSISIGDQRQPLAILAATLRWNMQDKSQPAQMTLGDPTDADAEWVEATLIEDIIPYDAYRALMRRIDSMPEYYCADPDEGEKLQQLVFASLGVRDPNTKAIAA